MDIIDDATTYFFEVECGIPLSVSKPHWCQSLEEECRHLSNWKAAYRAGDYYEEAIRPLMTNDGERACADRVFEEFFWAGVEGEANSHHDLVDAPRFTGYCGLLLFAFAPESVDPFLDSLSALISRFEKMNLRSIAPASMYNNWYASPDEWISYLKEWMEPFAAASKMKAGLIAHSC
ncbi:hypothetical protein F2P44_26625 [Massilia sp. CCM 8695]|uniref:DUF1877 family protein n=1 Tax=Massilia frigida TaxID=2609281 RepID=A0ABX0NHK5_9BURK|nr:hypothetical protein [Massilia frigida]NHZ82821.1 hypothetical protein [Massilia frigida]